MGNQREIRQLTPRNGPAVVIPIRPGASAQVHRVFGNPNEGATFYMGLWLAGEPIRCPNLDGPDVELVPQPSDCLVIQSGGKMWCGYDSFVERVRDLAPFLENALFYAGDESDYIDEFRLVGGALECRRVHSGFYLSVEEFLGVRGPHQET